VLMAQMAIGGALIVAGALLAALGSGR